MVPRKIAELVFRRKLLLLLPILLVPLLATRVAPHTDEYEASATVWVTIPPGGSLLLGTYNSYLSPAQNQVNAITDVLATDSFRLEVARDAGLAKESGSDGRLTAKSPFSVYSYAKGVNVLAIVGRSRSAESAKKLVDATVQRFGEAAQAQAEREAGVGAEYYRQQLAVAERALEVQRDKIYQYVAANPEALIPGSAASLDIDYLTLQRDLESQRTIVNDLQNRLQTIEFRRVSAPQSQDASFVVQDAAVLPKSPLPPSVTRRFGPIIAGLIVGLLISAAYVYITYRTDESIVSQADVPTLSVLAEIPELRPMPRYTRVQPAAWILQRRHRHFARRAASTLALDEPGEAAS